MAPVNSRINGFSIYYGLFASFSLVSSLTKSVTLVSVHIGNNPLYGYYVAHPVYVVAVEQIRKLYPLALGNMTYVNIYLPGYDLCQDGGDNAARFFTDFYFRNPKIFNSNDTYPVIFSPECTNQVLVLADLVREFDLPLFTSVAGDSRLTSRARYPTTSAMASLARADSLAAITALLDRFHWRTIALFCDKLSQFPGLNFYTGQCGDIRELFTNHGYTWVNQPFDTAKATNFRSLLEASKMQTRIYLVLTLPEFVRELMIEAHRLDMTAGDYVFIALQPTRRPGVHELDWRNAHDDASINQIALEAFKTLILLTGIGPNWKDIKNLTSRFLAVSQELHNNTYSSLDEENELQICIFESTRMFAQVFDENYPQVFNLRTAEFMQKFFARTYSFAGRNVSTDSVGSKINPVVVGRLNPVSRSMEVAMMYDTIGNRFVSIRPNLWYWKNQERAPPDVPLCGFQNDKCPTSNRGIASGLISSLLIGGLFISAIAIRTRIQLHSTWWLLSILVREPGESESNCKYDDLMSSQKVTVTQLGRCQNWGNTQINVYRLVSRSSSKISVAVLRRNTRFLRYLRDVASSVPPQQFGALFGIALNGRDMYFVSQAGPTGSLRSLLQDNSEILDREFQNAFCWDLIEGVEYIHSTKIGFHGNLTSHVCFVDARFTLKISNTAYEQLTNLLDLDRDPLLGLPFNKEELIWKPPEVRDACLLDPRCPNPLTDKQKKTFDMYAVAVIMFEIWTLQSPEWATDLLLSNSQYRIAGHYASDGPPSAYNMSPKLQELLADTLGHPESRPTAKQFIHELRKISTKKGSIVEHLLQRLQLQTQEMEHAVMERTRQLEAEMVITDTLLSEMLPPSIVHKLRNNMEITAEVFDSVTLMFSDLPEFEGICAKSSPLTIILFLNAIYSLFDGLIAVFDLYKVETIKDSYLVASGLPSPNSGHAREVCCFAISILQQIKTIQDPVRKREIQLRVGINSGAVVASVIGVRMPRYCLFGDTMNTASRMESTGEGGKIHVSSSTMKFVSNSSLFDLEARGVITVKGKGSMQTYWLRPSTTADIPGMVENRRRSICPDESSFVYCDTTS